MILVDLQQICIANMYVQMGNNSSKLDEAMLRHMILNTLRGIRSKFTRDYGELVIACDHTSWRKTFFPYYKANRRKSMAESDMDWKSILEAFGTIKQELKEHFPYPLILVDGAEADDVIGVLAHKYGTEYGLNFGEQILIVSGDKDFGQLQIYDNVSQYDPVKKKMIKVDKPREFLLEHVIRGDTGDGVPNFLSPDNSLVVGERQKPISSKKLETWLKQGREELLKNADHQRNLIRNETLIDLRYTPELIRDAILNQFESYDKTIDTKKRSKLINYFIEHRLKMLADKIQEF